MWSQPTEFGTWYFSDEARTKMEGFSSQFHHQEEYSLENFNPWSILFGNKDQPPLFCQQCYTVESEDESDDGPEESMPAPNPSHNVNQVIDTKPEEPLREMLMNSKQVPVLIPIREEESTQHHGLHSDESGLLSRSQRTIDEFDGGIDGITEQMELLENGASELDLTTLPNSVVAEVFRGLTDRGLCHAIEAVCTMKPTDQARFNSIVITNLLLPRLQECNVRCSNQVKAAFGQFISCCPVISCQQFVAPLVITPPMQHMDIIKDLLRSLKQPQKDLILKALLDSLSSMDEHHLALSSLLIGPSGNIQVKQQLINILAQSVDKFPRDIRFGKILLAVIPLVSALPDLKEQLTNVVNRHDSVVKNKAIKLLCN